MRSVEIILGGLKLQAGKWAIETQFSLRGIWPWGKIISDCPLQGVTTMIPDSLNDISSRQAQLGGVFESLCSRRAFNARFQGNPDSNNQFFPLSLGEIYSKRVALASSTEWSSEANQGNLSLAVGSCWLNCDRCLSAIWPNIWSNSHMLVVGFLCGWIILCLDLFAVGFVNGLNCLWLETIFLQLMESDNSHSNVVVVTNCGRAGHVQLSQLAS